MKRLLNFLVLSGFILNEKTGIYCLNNMEVKVRKTYQPSEFICVFSYSDHTKHGFIMHYSNKINGFQPALTRSINNSIADCKEFFNL